MKRNLKKAIYILILIVIGLIYSNITENSVPFPDWKKGMVHMYVIDVGQADSTLFVLPDGETLLVDAGNREDAGFVINFLTNLGINKLDTVIATHPHEDHIGGMTGVIESFEIGTFYMPDAINTTSYYEDMLDSLTDKDIEVKFAESGVMVKEGEYKIEILSPEEKEYTDLNHVSAVTRVEYKDTSFLLMGDAEKINEYDLIDNYGEKIASDVLRIGHHGSDTSSAYDFLDTVNPEIAIISLGANNDYGHPHKEVMERLDKLEIPVLRTDKSGTILIESNGKEISYVTERNDINEGYSR